MSICFCVFLDLCLLCCAGAFHEQQFVLVHPSLPNVALGSLSTVLLDAIPSNMDQVMEAKGDGTWQNYSFFLKRDISIPPFDLKDVLAFGEWTRSDTFLRKKRQNSPKIFFFSILKFCRFLFLYFPFPGKGATCAAFYSVNSFYRVLSGVGEHIIHEGMGALRNK